MLRFNSQQPTANSQQPTANSQQPTANSQQPTANCQLPTATNNNANLLKSIFVLLLWFLPFQSAQAILGCNRTLGSGTGEIGINATCGEPDPIIIRPPASLTVPTSGNNVSYVISWTAPGIGTPSRYELEEHGSMEPAGRYTQVYSGLSLSKTITSQSPGTWSYRVRACEGATCSAWRVGTNDIVVTDPNAGGGNSGGTPPTVTPGATPNHDASLGAIGGRFRVDESGQVNYSVSIAVAPGRGGITPQLGLSYSSQAGNGQLGVGWSISGLSAITRCRQTWEQDGLTQAVDLSLDDRFCLDGQRLILISGTYGASGSLYKTEIDSQTEVYAYGGTTGNPTYFKVFRKDGSKSEYGVTADSRVYSNATGSTGIITTWAQNKFIDNPRLNAPNSYRFSYNIDSVTQEFTLSRVDYTGAQSNAIVFYYDENRPDKSTGWSATGSRFELRKRLNRIDSLAGGSLVRRYRLSYINTGTAQLSKLKLLQECSYDAGAEICLKPLTFGWLSTTSGIRSAYSSNSASSGFTAGNNIQPIDINGDGMQDVAYNSGAYLMVGRSVGNSLSYTVGKTLDSSYRKYWKQLDYNGDGQTDLMYPRRWNGVYTWTISLSNGTSFNGGDISTAITINSKKEAERMRVMDVNSDGLPDLVYQRQSNTQFYVKYLHINSSGNRYFSAETPLTFDATGAKTGDIPAGAVLTDIDIKESQPVDVNSDGIVDVFAKAQYQYTGYRYLNARVGTVYGTFTFDRWVFFTGYQNAVNNRDSFSYQPYYVMDYLAGLPTTASGYRILDINGDGLSDVLYKINNSTGDWYLLLNKGQGEFGGLSSTYAMNIGTVPDNGNYMQFTDWDQDGKTDLIYPGSGGIMQYRRWTGSNFAPAVSMGLSPRDKNKAARIFMDVNGDGIQDWLNLQGTSSQLHLSTDTFIRNNVINHFDNGLGAVTDIVYKPLTDANVYTKGTDANRMDYGNGSPVFDVISPMYVVASATSNSPGITVAGTASPLNYGLNATSTVKYRYQGARIQSGGRGFLGFEALSTLDPQSGVETTTSYLQEFPYTGRPLSTVRRLLGTHDLWSDAPASCSDCPPPSCNLLDPLAQNHCQFDFGSLGGSSSGSNLLPQVNGSGKTSAPTASNEYADSSDGYTIELSRATNTWKTLTPNGTSSSVRLPYLQKAVEINRVLNQNISGSIPYSYSGIGHTMVSSVTTTNSYDNWANPVSITVITRNGSGTQLLKKTTINSYGSGNYPRYGRLTRTTVTTQTTAGSTIQTRTSDFGYDGTTLMLNKEIIEPNGGITKKLITVYQHDDYGNITKKATCSSDVVNCGVTTTQHTNSTSYPNYINRWSTSIYDISGTFANASANTLGQIGQTVLSRNLMGQVLHARDIYGTNSYNEYDAFGTLIHSYNDAGNESWAGKEAYAGDYGIIMRITNVTVGAPTKEQYLDAVGRTIRTSIQGFDGTFIYKDTLTDRQGQVRLQSLPYKSGAAQYWNETQYDVLGQVLKTKSPDGSHNLIAHNGLTTISTIGIGDGRINGGSGLTKTETRNALGQLYKITDAIGGSITYSYDAYGKLRFMYSKNAASTRTITTQIQYDNLGRKIKTLDPDMGTWTYNYNALGEVTTQRDANLQKVNNYYDPLGRLTRRLDYNLYTALVGDSRWNYDTLKGHLLSTYNLKDGNYREDYTYDGYGRIKTRKTTVDGKAYTEENWYDSAGRIASHQSRVAGLSQIPVIDNSYNSYGYLYQQKDRTTAKIIWQALASDNFGHITHARQYSGKYETRHYYTPETGLLNQQTMGFSGSAIKTQSLSYSWDSLGNLRYRRDDNSGKQENFSYDQLNRLTRAQMGSTIKTYSFDDYGNITQKDGQSYQYNTTGAGPHALSKSSGSSYYYDNNGNMTSGGGKTIVYATFNKPTQINKGSTHILFNYNQDRSRYKRIHKVGTTLIDTKVTAAGMDVITKGSTKEVRLSVGNALMKYIYSGTSTIPTKTVSYIYKDHLGSPDVIINAFTNAVTRMSFDSYGNRRSSNWVSSLLSYQIPALVNITDRGYTGHEQLDDVGLIHMNGRVYDPTLGRFLSADPNIQAPTDTQSLNRYAYVMNNPLSATDPSGYFGLGLGKAWKKIRPFASIIALAIPGVGPWAAMTWYNAAAFGFTVGAVTTGTFKGALISAFSAVAFQQIGEFAREGSIGAPQGQQTWQVGKNAYVTGTKFAKVVALHAVAGGVISVLNGSKFGYGFVSAGFTKGITPALGFIGNNDGLQLLAASVVGGTASVLSGGKFANGARTAAFQFALNYLSSEKRSVDVEEYKKQLVKDLIVKVDAELERINSLTDKDFNKEFHTTNNDNILNKTAYQGQLSLMSGALRASALTSLLLDEIKFVVENSIPSPKLLKRIGGLAPSPNIEYKFDQWSVGCKGYQCGIYSPSGKFIKASLINRNASRFEP